MNKTAQQIWNAAYSQALAAGQNQFQAAETADEALEAEQNKAEAEAKAKQREGVGT